MGYKKMLFMGGLAGVIGTSVCLSQDLKTEGSADQQKTRFCQVMEEDNKEALLKNLLDDWKKADETCEEVKDKLLSVIERIMKKFVNGGVDDEYLVCNNSETLEELNKRRDDESRYFKEAVESRRQKAESLLTFVGNNPRQIIDAKSKIHSSKGKDSPALIEVFKRALMMCYANHEKKICKEAFLAVGRSMLTDSELLGIFEEEKESD